MNEQDLRAEADSNIIDLSGPDWSKNVPEVVRRLSGQAIVTTPTIVDHITGELRPLTEIECIYSAAMRLLMKRADVVDTETNGNQWGAEIYPEPGGSVRIDNHTCARMVVMLLEGDEGWEKAEVFGRGKRERQTYRRSRRCV